MWPSFTFATSFKWIIQFCFVYFMQTKIRFVYIIKYKIKYLQLKWKFDVQDKIKSIKIGQLTPTNCTMIFHLATFSPPEQLYSDPKIPVIIIPRGTKPKVKPLLSSPSTHLSSSIFVDDCSSGRNWNEDISIVAHKTYFSLDFSWTFRAPFGGPAAKCCTPSNPQRFQAGRRRDNVEK